MINDKAEVNIDELFTKNCSDELIKYIKDIEISESSTDFKSLGRIDYDDISLHE